MDGKNEGKINRAQIKGLLVVHGTRNMVPDDDIKALIRRLDIDNDGEVSFSDFFSAMLPYFIYGNLKALNIRNPLAEKS
jgi:Ca2+-binding EF-hand superfamily protein